MESLSRPRFPTPFCAAALAAALAIFSSAPAHAYNICSASDQAALLAIAYQVDLDPGPVQFRQGEWATVRGSGFRHLPTGFDATFTSLLPAFDASGCARPGSLTTRFDDAPETRVVSDTEMEVRVPVGVREGRAIFRLQFAGVCTWASAGRFVTARRIMSLASTKRSRHLDATPAQPAAPGAILYLDFDGYRDPAYPLSGQGEVEVDLPRLVDTSAIDEIVTRVREDFEPFDAVVTTTEPRGLDGHPEIGMRVAIGGEPDPTDCMDGIDNDGDGLTDYADGTNARPDPNCGDRWWWNNEASPDVPRPIHGPTRLGVSTDPSLRNTVLVAERDSNGVRTPQRIAQTISHELGHAIGMMTGHPLSHYQRQHSTSDKTPLLGANWNRDVWFKHDQVLLGQDRCTGTYPAGPQDDFASLLSVLGERRDDHPDSPEFGLPLADAGRDASGRRMLELEGVVGMNPASWPVCAPHACSAGTPPSTGHEDVDFFQFQVDGGYFEVTAETLSDTSGYAHAGNLDADLELWIYRNEDLGWEKLLDHGNLQQSRDTFGKLRWPETSLNAEAGVYAVGVKSEGGVGDLGRYGVLARGRDIKPLQLGVAGDDPRDEGGKPPVLIPLPVALPYAEPWRMPTLVPRVAPLVQPFVNLAPVSAK